MSVLDLVRDGIAPLTAYTVPRVHPPVKLDAIESPWSLPDDARARMAEVLAAVEYHRYPDPRATEVREALAARVGGPADSLVIGSGSDEIISILLTALARPREGAERAVVLSPSPSFVIYRIAAITHGLEPVEVRSGYNRNGLGAFMELRDEKVAMFVRQLPRGRHNLSYRLRAEIPGKFSALPTRAEGMYAPELRANSDEMKLGVRD